MAAVAPIMEETAGTMPLTVIVVCGMHIILAPERRFEASKLNSFRFFRVTPGLSDLIDHT
jgi:hypothetical protein